MNETSGVPSTQLPPEALGSIVRENVLIEGRSFFIYRPDQSDRLLDHPAVRSAFETDEYLPYWADLWPAARMLAKAILREPWTSGPLTSTHLPDVGEMGWGGEGFRREVLEIGCGLGLPGIAALSVGLKVTFSDYDATALRFAADNARANGFHEFRLRQIDWRHPPDDIHVPVVLASDLLYELRNVEPLVGLIKKVLFPGGLCLLTDQDRVPSHSLRQTLTAEGFAFETQTMHAGEPGGRRFKGTLYRITAPG